MSFDVCYKIIRTLEATTGVLTIPVCSNILWYVIARERCRRWLVLLLGGMILFLYFLKGAHTERVGCS